MKLIAKIFFRGNDGETGISWFHFPRLTAEWGRSIYLAVQPSVTHQVLYNSRSVLKMWMTVRLAEADVWIEPSVWVMQCDSCSPRNFAMQNYLEKVAVSFFYERPYKQLLFSHAWMCVRLQTMIKRKEWGLLVDCLKTKWFIFCCCLQDLGRLSFEDYLQGPSTVWSGISPAEITLEMLL